MSHNSRELDKLQRGFTKLVGPAKARTLRKQIEKKILLAAKQSGAGKPAKTEAEIIKDLFRQKQAGWVKAEGATKPVLVQAKTGCPFLGFNGKEITTIKTVHPTKPVLDTTAYQVHTESFEGNVPWMYLDTKGNVTVGIGHLLGNAGEAKQLFFVRSGTGIRATAAEIDRAFNAVARARFGSNVDAQSFRNLTQIELTTGEIDNIYKSDVAVFHTAVKGLFPDFLTYPEIAKRAIVDLPFTMGVSGFRGIFKDFQAAVRSRNWKVAAVESERRFKNKKTGKISANMVRRNAIIHGWLEQAARLDPFFLNDKCTTKPRLSPKLPSVAL